MRVTPVLLAFALAVSAATGPAGTWRVQFVVPSGSRAVNMKDGKLIEITMKGKLTGDVINGTATIGTLGEGPLQARRTADE